MKNSILVATVVVGAMMSSCSNNGEKVKSQDAQEVSVIKNDETSTFNKVTTGSFVDWRASHLGGAQKRFGKINVKSAQLLVNQSRLSNATIIMDMAAFTVENFPEGDENTAKLAGHLQSSDFFDVATYPTATFELTKVESAQGNFSSIVTGNLTIMDITKSISFKADISISETKTTIRSEDFAINRSDWNLTYNAEGTAGVPVDYLIANDIGFTINVTVSKQSKNG